MNVQKLISASLRVGGITLISRILGYVRDMLIASFIGASLLNDIFIAAFRFANLFRTIFGEGAFSTAFIPTFSSTLSSKGKNFAIVFASKIQSLLIIQLIIFSIIMITCMPLVVTLTTPGFVSDPYAFNLTVELSRIVFPYLAFISISAFYGGIMNSIGIFSPFAASSILLNITMIIGIMFRQEFITTAHALSYSVLIAGVLELLWMLYFANKYNILVPIRKPKISKKVKRVFKLMGPALISSGIIQINIMVDMLIVSFIPNGISYLYFADRITQLPLALIGTTLGVVILPAMSAAFKLKETHKMSELFSYSFCILILFSMPSMIGIVMLSENIVEILFGRGAFSENAVQKTSQALTVLGFAIPAFSLNKIFSTVFFSHKDTKTPLKIAIFILILNAVLSVLLIGFLEHVGVALASTITAWINIFIMGFILSKRSHLYLDFQYVKKECIKCFIASSVVLITLILYKVFYVNFSHHKTLFMIFIIFFTMILYFTTLFFLKSDILQKISRNFFKRKENINEVI